MGRKKKVERLDEQNGRRDRQNERRDKQNGQQEKKNGWRDTGVQAKGGKLYIVVQRSVIEEGSRALQKKWVSTGLSDTRKNVDKAKKMREAMMSSGSTALTNNLDVLVTVYVDLFLRKKKRTVADTTYAG